MAGDLLPAERSAQYITRRPGRFLFEAATNDRRRRHGVPQVLPGAFSLSHHDSLLTPRTPSRRIAQAIPREAHGTPGCTETPHR